VIALNPLLLALAILPIVLVSNLDPAPGRHLTSPIFNFIVLRLGITWWGVLTSVFVHPAVPQGAGLVRFSAHAHLTPSDVLRTALALAESLAELGIDPKSVSPA
jgi:hypothetical protein